MTEAEVQNKKHEKRRNELKDAYKKTFGTAHGKLVLADLRFSLQEVTMVNEPNEVFYAMGRRAVMLMIEHKLKDRENGI